MKISITEKFYFWIIENKFIRNVLILFYKLGKKIPWTLGYYEYKWKSIKYSLQDSETIKSFKTKSLPSNYGKFLDERIVEYSWAFVNLNNNRTNLLDAGSILNFSQILEQKKISNKNLTICTYYPENKNYNNKRISYVYDDLRDLSFKNNHFEEIVCLSTLEHIDMDNLVYGYNIANSSRKNAKSYEYLKVIIELERVLSNKGVLLISFPFGEFEKHVFFQQFDRKMVQRIEKYLKQRGEILIDYFRYTNSGWEYCDEKQCLKGVSFNPQYYKANHTKKDFKLRGVCGICCIKFKNLDYNFLLVGNVTVPNNKII